MITNKSCLLLQIGSAEQYAQAGDVILSPEVAAVAAGLCTVDPLESNDARLVSMSQQAVVSARASVHNCNALHSMLVQKARFNACLVSGICVQVDFACPLRVCPALCSFLIMQVSPGMKLLSVLETEWVLHQLMCKRVQNSHHMQSMMHTLFVSGHNLWMPCTDLNRHCTCSHTNSSHALIARTGPRIGRYSGLYPPDPKGMADVH